MRRTAMRPRTIPLTRSSGLRRGTGMGRQPAVRVPERVTGRPAPVDIPPASRATVQGRSAGFCEARIDGCSSVGSDWHHRQRRREGDHRPVNGLWLCRPCHGWVHGHPALARAAGWIVSAWQDPEVTPVRVRGRLLLLTDSGYAQIEGGRA